MGFEASKYDYDYLAYFIAVQHKYFQPNKLTDSLESFVVYIQGELYNASEDIDLCGRTIKDWKILGVKVYETEKELLKLTAAIESKSTHPIALAIVLHAGDVIKNVSINNIEEISGHGLKGTIDGKEVLAGNLKLLKKFNIMKMCKLLITK